MPKVRVRIYNEKELRTVKALITSYNLTYRSEADHYLKDCPEWKHIVSYTNDNQWRLFSSSNGKLITIPQLADWLEEQQNKKPFDPLNKAVIFSSASEIKAICKYTGKNEKEFYGGSAEAFFDELYKRHPNITAGRFASRIDVINNWYWNPVTSYHRDHYEVLTFEEFTKQING